MGLRETWVDKVDGISTILAADVNGIAHAVIDIEENGAGGGSSVETENPVFSGKLTIDGVEIYRDDSFEEAVVVKRPTSSNGTPSSAFSFGYDQAFLGNYEFYHRGNLKNLSVQGNSLDEVEKNAFMANTGLDVVLGDIETALDSIITVQNGLIGGDDE